YIPDALQPLLLLVAIFRHCSCSLYPCQSLLKMNGYSSIIIRIDVKRKNNLHFNDKNEALNQLVKGSFVIYQLMCVVTSKEVLKRLYYCISVHSCNRSNKWNTFWTNLHTVLCVTASSNTACFHQSIYTLTFVHFACWMSIK